MNFFFAGGDAEMSSLRLCLGGDVGGTGISFLLLWGGVGGIGERIGKECCGSCPGGVDGIGERIGKDRLELSLQNLFTSTIFIAPNSTML